ncbi:hypothetical protein [Marmoricola sp. RAF53]|uniref:hypothetical protein n=1 Tax=Marmoricola sp. RAF53 TaxID=3233059 RepID=UPI003F9A2DC4
MHARPVRLLTVLGAAAALSLSLTACGSDSNDGPRTQPDTELSATPQAQAPSPAADAKVIPVKVQGETVTPSGVKVEVKPGQPVVFQIDADTAGELHVHSSPAQAIQYPAGTSQAQITISKPGVVEAEIEQLGTLVVQLEVK